MQKPDIKNWIEKKEIHSGTEKISVTGINFPGYSRALERYIKDLEETIIILRANPSVSLKTTSKDGKAQILYEWAISSNLEEGKIGRVIIDGNYYASDPAYNEEASQFLRNVPVEIDIEDCKFQKLKLEAI